MKIKFTTDQEAEIINHVSSIYLWIRQYESDKFDATDVTLGETKKMTIAIIAKLATHQIAGKPICFENNEAMLIELLNELRKNQHTGDTQ